MAQVQVAKRRLNLKIAYYGAPGAGKATNLRALEGAVPGPKGRVGQVALDPEVALRFEFQPAWLEPVRGLRVNLQLFTVPADRWAETHPHSLVLQGADAVVFVVDSRPEGLEAAARAWEHLAANVAAQSERLGELPVVFQWNKRDLAGALPLERLEAAVAGWPEPRADAPACEAVASRGQGVLESVRQVAEATTDALRGRLDELL